MNGNSGSDDSLDRKKVSTRYFEAMDVQCPVPLGQRPTQELLQLQTDPFFSWAALPTQEYALRLVGTWLAFALLVGVPVASGTYDIHKQALQVGLSAGASSLAVVTALVLRLYLGWDYVKRRLLSATVEYEETGWYDSQVWVKPAEILSRDRLIGNFQMKPVIERARASMLACASAVVTTSCILQYILPSPVTPIDVYSLPEDTSPENTSYHSGGKPYNPDARLQSRQIYLQYSSQLDYEDVARTYEPWAFEGDDGGVDAFEDAEKYEETVQRIKQSLIDGAELSKSRSAMSEP
eukprot:CAMPEP_0114234058 /NCGR_PEP_ID=MMETSP0058-20121206/5511_1 /TAXON_ID=36894 /ORGANISM="Pyramimonas parkeae, CCMP726" /LENGTH=293 /DNA_ID=CAMNT_0001345721 /DNA_START=282 /DNA_END=1163 /DNA_ORIENTATION=+